MSKKVIADSPFEEMPVEIQEVFPEIIPEIIPEEINPLENDNAINLFESEVVEFTEKGPEEITIVCNPSPSGENVYSHRVA